MSGTGPSPSTALRAVVVLHGKGHSPPLVGAHLSACDRALLDKTLALRDDFDVHVTAVVLGSDTYSESLLGAAVGAGCDRGVYISMQPMPDQQADTEALADTYDSGSHQALDDTLVSPIEDTLRGASTDDTLVNKRGIDGLDYLGRAELVRAAISRLGCDILIAGACTHSDHRGVRAPALAELMSVPHLIDVVAVRPTNKQQTVELTQQSNGEVHTFTCSWPLVVSLAVRGVRGANSAETAKHNSTIEHLDADELPVNRRMLARELAGSSNVTRASKMGQLSSARELIARLFEDRLLQ